MSGESACKKNALPDRGSVVGTVSNVDSLPGLAGLPLAGMCDIVEFRLDAYPAAMPAVEAAISALPVPALITARDPHEGGMSGLGFSPRLALLNSMAGRAGFIDVELRNFALFAEAIDHALENGALVIASHHDFAGMPSASEIDDLVGRAAEGGAHIAKLAVTPRNTADLAVLAARLEGDSPIPLSLMGMGPMGRVSRLLLGQLGSRLNYGFLDEPTASGQWPVGELKRLIEILRAENPATAVSAETVESAIAPTVP
jgi:3-dehydroquinate dehydratase-1